MRDPTKRTIEPLESDLNEHNHRFAAELPETPVWVQADPCRLEQVLHEGSVTAATAECGPGGETTVRPRTLPPQSTPTRAECYKQLRGTPK